MITTKPIEYFSAPYGYITTIPKGVTVVPATNLPEGPKQGYWVENWEGMTEHEESWMRNYGFHLTNDDFTE